MKLEIIKSLQGPCDRATYGRKLREAADQLGQGSGNWGGSVALGEVSPDSLSVTTGVGEVSAGGTGGCGAITGDIAACGGGDKNDSDSPLWGLLRGSSLSSDGVQYKTSDRCERHSLRLLPECPNCGARFPIPALWQDGWCTRCFTTVADSLRYLTKGFRPSVALGLLCCSIT